MRWLRTSLPCFLQKCRTLVDQLVKSFRPTEAMGYLPISEVRPCPNGRAKQSQEPFRRTGANRGVPRASLLPVCLVTHACHAFCFSGAGVIAAALVIVAIATAGVVGKQPDETLAQVGSVYTITHQPHVPRQIIVVCPGSEATGRTGGSQWL